MKIAIVDVSTARASIIEEGLASLDDREVFILTQREGLLKRIEEIAPDIVLIDLGNPSRDMLEEYFAVSRALARPIAMFVDESDDDAIAASIDAGVSAFVVDGLDLLPLAARTALGDGPALILIGQALGRVAPGMAQNQAVQRRSFSNAGEVAD